MDLQQEYQLTINEKMQMKYEMEKKNRIREIKKQESQEKFNFSINSILLFSIYIGTMIEICHHVFR